MQKKSIKETINRYKAAIGKKKRQLHQVAMNKGSQSERIQLPRKSKEKFEKRKSNK